MVLHQLPLPQCLHEKGLLPRAQNTGGFGEFGRCWTFFLLGGGVVQVGGKGWGKVDCWCVL